MRFTGFRFSKFYVCDLFLISFCHMSFSGLRKKINCSNRFCICRALCHNKKNQKFEVMANKILITILLLMVWIDHNNIEAVRETRRAANANYDVPKVRQARSTQPFFSGLIELWNAIVNIHNLYLSVSASEVLIHFAIALTMNTNLCWPTWISFNSPLAKERDQQCFATNLWYFSRWFHGHGNEETTGECKLMEFWGTWRWNCNNLMFSLAVRDWNLDQWAEWNHDHHHRTI